MANCVHVRADISAADNFAELLIKNGYGTSSTYATKVAHSLNVFNIYTEDKMFYRFYDTKEDCLTVEDFIDLFL